MTNKLLKYKYSKAKNEKIKLVSRRNIKGFDSDQNIIFIVEKLNMSNSKSNQIQQLFGCSFLLRNFTKNYCCGMINYEY